MSALDVINRIAADYGLTGRSKHRANLWNPPKGWRGTVYLFGYTPWRTKDPDTGKEGFFALKYRRFRDGRCKLVKQRRFGKRWLAKKYALKWYNDYYRGDHK